LFLPSATTSGAAHETENASSMSGEGANGPISGGRQSATSGTGIGRTRGRGKGRGKERNYQRETWSLIWPMNM
jgi:hypothetical protein